MYQHQFENAETLLPKLRELSVPQGTAMDMMGIEQQSLELDLTAVGTWEDPTKRSFTRQRRMASSLT
jgi:hypothetical protein